MSSITHHEFLKSLPVLS